MNSEKINKMEDVAAEEKIFGGDILKRFVRGSFVPIITAISIKIVAWAFVSVSIFKSLEFADLVNKYLQADWINHIVGFLIVYGIIKGLVKMDSNWRGSIRLLRGFSHVIVCFMILMLVYPTFCVPYQEMIQGKNIKDMSELWFKSITNCEISSYIFAGAIIGLIYGLMRWIYNICRTFSDGIKAFGDYMKTFVKGRRSLGLQRG